MSPRKKVCVVVPLFNEEAVVPTLYERLGQSAKRWAHDFEFVFVNDGSTDGTLKSLLALADQDARVVVLDLARNFGQHSALTAGIDHANGDAVILMDADMEDNPNHLGTLLDQWDQGYDVVYAIRGQRHAGRLKNLAFKLYHAVSGRTEMHVPMAGTFSLLDRQVVECLKQMREHNRYIPGLRAWAGFRQKGVILDRGRRYDGQPRVSTGRLVRLAFDSFVSFSKLPLKLASLMGLFFAGVGLVAAVAIAIMRVTMGFRLIGWASLMVTVLFASGIQLICLGILGEYIAQILDETKGRPIYLLRAKIHRGDVETVR